MSTNSENVCAVCQKSSLDLTPLQQCSKCKTRVYCGADCQRSDWAAHKETCKPPALWYDKFRKCQDRNFHEGRLELITWDCDKEGTGWGHCLKEESEDLKKQFETEFGGDLEKFHEYWPQGFRWTCCGTDAGMDWGCDHHGTGSRPCTCDYCRNGEPLPNDIYKEVSASRIGLHLSRGPDPRSH